MLDAFIIDEIKRREREAERRRDEKRPRPDPPPPPAPLEDDEPAKDRGVVIIDYSIEGYG